MFLVPSKDGEVIRCSNKDNRDYNKDDKGKDISSDKGKDSKECSKFV